MTNTFNALIILDVMTTSHLYLKKDAVVLLSELLSENCEMFLV